MKLVNRTFIISGGSSGLGRATVKDLVIAGAFAAVLDIEPPPTDLLSTSATSRVKYFRVDVTDSHALEKTVDRIAEWTVETKAIIGGVINCAGIAEFCQIIDRTGKNLHSAEMWDRSIAVNLTGAFNLTRLAVRHLVRVPPEGSDNERGVVIFVSSSAAYEGQPATAAYAASKGAIRSIILPLSRDLARHGIRVVAIAPGPFTSPMAAKFPEQLNSAMQEKAMLFPKRFGLPFEFAKTVRWILECAYVNGETVKLTGGGRIPAWL
jgi:NAD(P)-dependent dehydrogenase (short-subunit alcohol dehydrogenase family)